MSMTPEELKRMVEYHHELGEYLKRGQVEYIHSEKKNSPIQTECLPMSTHTKLALNKELHEVFMRISDHMDEHSFGQPVGVSFSHAAMLMGTSPSRIASLAHAGILTGNVRDRRVDVKSLFDYISKQQ